MQCANKTLVLFTSQYPYGLVSETYLETEIIYLAQKFEKIYILPSTTSDEYRSTPRNVEIVTEFSDLTFSKSQKIKLLFFNLFSVYSVLISEIKDKGLSTCFKNKSVLLDYLGTQLGHKSRIKGFVSKQDATKTVFYDYWFCNNTLALALIKNKNKNIKFVARAHGFDLYDERWGEMGVPYRRFKSSNIDQIHFISKNGYDYFKSKVKKPIDEKMTISYLGVMPHEVKSKTAEKVPVIISISRVVSFKNVHEIPFLLAQLDRPFKWIHFGDGEDMETLKNIAKKCLSEEQYELRGNVLNENLIEFLQNYHVDLLLSRSSSEGLPVSMMEVQSFGIPILSTAVGGIPEIVINGKTGFLFDNSENDIQLLDKALNHPFSKDEIVSFFNNHFNATINYSKFADTLCCLGENIPEK